jgi:hypothetical protein
LVLFITTTGENIVPIQHTTKVGSLHWFDKQTCYNQNFGITPIYLPINFKNNKPKNDLNLSINVTRSNGPLSITQIVNHFINQNNKVQIDYPITLVGHSFFKTLELHYSL